MLTDCALKKYDSGTSVPVIPEPVLVQGCDVEDISIMRIGS